MENNLKTVVSFEYADEGKKTVIVVKAANIEPRSCDPLSAMVPGLTLTGGIVTELDENGQEVSEAGSSPDAILPCQDSYPDEMLSAVIDMVSRGENVDPASGKTGLIKVLEACDEFKKLSDDWASTGNIAFVMDGRPVPKEISHYASYYAIVGASRERLYYEGICYGGYVCLDAKTKTVIEGMEDKEEDAMMEDFHNGELLWYTPGFPKLAEESRFGSLASEDDIFADPSKIFNQEQDKAPAVERNLVVSFEMLSKGKNLSFRVTGRNIHMNMCEDGCPAIDFDKGKVEVMEDNQFVPFEPNEGFSAVDVAQDIIDRVVRGETADKDERDSLVRVISSDPIFEQIIKTLTPEDNLFMEIAGRKIPKKIVHNNPCVGFYTLSEATEDILYYFSEACGTFLMVRACNGVVITDDFYLVGNSLCEDEQNGKIIYPEDVKHVIARAVISEAGTHAIFEVKADMVTVHNLDTDSANIPCIHVDGGVVNKYDLEGNLIEKNMAMPRINSKYPDMANMFLNEVLLGGISRSENKVQNGFFIFGDKRPFQLDESGIVEILECCDEVRRCMDFWNSDKNILFADYDRSGRLIHKEISFNGNFFGLFSITQNLIFYKKVDMFQDRTFYKHDTEPGDEYIAIDRVTGAVVLDETEVIPYIEDIEMYGKNCTLGVEFYEPLLSYALASQRLNH